MRKFSPISWLLLGCIAVLSWAGCGCDCDDPDNSTPNALGKTLFNAFQKGDQETFMRFVVVPEDVDSLWNGRVPKTEEDQRNFDGLKEAFARDYDRTKDEFLNTRESIASRNGFQWEDCSFDESKFSTGGTYFDQDVVRIRTYFDCKGEKMVLDFGANIDISGAWKASGLPYFDRPQ